MYPLFPLVLAGLLTFSPLSLAETAPLSDEQVEQFSQQFAETRERLKLTPQQEEALGPVLRESAQQQRNIFKSYGFERGKNHPELSFSRKRALFKEIRALKKDTNKKVSHILSPEQMKEYEAIQDETRQRLKTRVNSK